uniref:SLAM family member 7 n=1 Tax=Bos taurus TaxID=9913 RepID=G0YQL2_BOVIN|nr:SLAM family member 7 [Bos taurus]AEK94586.1 SLAM family member 7 variant 1 [Bos taurus]
MLGAPACFIFLLCQLTGPAASGIPKKLVGAIAKNSRQKSPCHSDPKA